VNGEPSGDDVREAWDAMASFWDEQMEAGNTWQRGLIQPSVERLLGLRSGERVLEIACGNGEFSRRMAEVGAEVIATDFSEAMLERARARGGDIRYLLVDGTDERALAALGSPGSFDAIVCNMAIMDMREIDPMASAAAGLVGPGGRFVFSTTHPAFNGNDVARVVEQTEDDTGVVRRYSVKVSGYITPVTGKGVALEGQPVTQWYFHRPISVIFEVFFRHGWVLDGLEEPVLPIERVPDGSTNRIFSELPGVLVARMRRP